MRDRQITGTIHRVKRQKTAWERYRDLNWWAYPRGRDERRAHARGWTWACLILGVPSLVLALVIGGGAWLMVMMAAWCLMPVAIYRLVPEIKTRPRDMVQRVPGTSDELVLIDYMAGPQVFANLFRRKTDGAEVWRAAPPVGANPDAWVDARIEGDHVVAQTWSGWTVVLDLASGMEQDRAFTK